MYTESNKRLTHRTDLRNQIQWYKDTGMETEMEMRSRNYLIRHKFQCYKEFQKQDWFRYNF